MSRTIKALPAGRQGFTLVELLIATTVSLILIVAVTSAYFVSSRIFIKEIGSSDIFWDGQRGMERLSREIRESRGVTSGEVSRVTFWWKDLNNNGTVNPTEEVRYYISNRSLMRSIETDVRTVANSIHRLSLAYVPSSINPTLVTITLTVSSETQIATFESKVRVRNQ